jgi:Chaperone of endosialidase/Secretion system C-terminal sorting domain
VVQLILLGTTFAIAQNNTTFSSSTNVFSVTTPLATGEPFRFASGLVTQLDTGAAFDFLPTSQWFSLGKFTPSAFSQTLYGFRIQRAGKGLVMGYSGGNQSSGITAGGNPFIQWVGNNQVGTPLTAQGNLEFRTSPSATDPTSDKLVFTLRADRSALLGEVPTAVIPFNSGAKMEINTIGFNTFRQIGLFVDLTNSGGGGSEARAAVLRSIQSSNSNSGVVTSSALETITNGANGNNIGINASTGNRANTSIGVSSNMSDLNTTTGGPTVTSSNKVYGFKTNVTSPGATSSSYGLFSEVVSSTVTGSINCGVFATASGTQSTTGNSNPTLPAPTGTYAGYFGGFLYASTSAFGSDARLKKDIKKEEKISEKLALLNPVTYSFIENDKSMKLGLPSSLQHGFIAQELEAVYPELVVDAIHPVFNEKNEQIGTKTLKAINYIGLISVLTASIKELSNEVADLKEKALAKEKTFVVNNQNKLSQKELNSIEANGYFMSQNIPNPFKDFTTIEYSVPENDREVSILILNLNGQIIKKYKLNDSKGTLKIDSASLQKGMYLYSLVSNGSELITKKMLLE